MAFSNRMSSHSGDVNEDPFFRHPGPPVGFGGFGGLFYPPQSAMLSAPQMGSTAVTPFGAMWPFGGGSPFAHMNTMFSDMERMMSQAHHHHGAAVPGAHSYSSSSVMHYSSTGGEGNAPRVYQASTSTRRAPGGIAETRKSVKDSQTGIHKMAIGHHIGERSHVVERQYNAQTREQEEHQEFVNIDETDARSFNAEWENRTRPTNQAFHAHTHHPALSHRRRQAETRGLPAASDIIGLSSTVGTDPNTTGTKQTHGKRRHRPPSLSHEDSSSGTEQPPSDSQQEASSSSHHSHHHHNHDRHRHKHARFQSPPDGHHDSQSSHAHPRRYHSPPPPPSSGGGAFSRPPLGQHGTAGLHASGSGTARKKGPVHT